MSSSLYVNGDASALSLPYLARLSAEVYAANTSINDNNEIGRLENESNRSQLVAVGADKFSVHGTPTPNPKTTGKTLVVAICGTSSPLQHLMNVKAQAYRGMYAVGRAFSPKPSPEGSDTDRAAVASNENSNPFENHEEAYRAGHREGWIEPAEKICHELIRLCGSCDHGNDNKCLNDAYDRIILTGHSRGGLLSYHVGVVLRSGIGSSETNSLNEARIQPFRGTIKVVAFGMPPPLCKPDHSVDLIAFSSRDVVSVWNRDDPVSNGSILKPPASSSDWWNPVSLPFKSPQKPPPKPPARASSLRGGSGMWGLLGNVAAAVVEATVDAAGTLASNVEKHHAVDEYVRHVSECGSNSPFSELPPSVRFQSQQLVVRLDEE
eukprot:jgi/Psemu1/21775/gm1.21775_g